MKEEDSDMGVQMGGAIEYKVKPGLVKGGCTREIIHSMLDILGLKSLCYRWRQLTCSYKHRAMSEVKTEDRFGIAWMSSPSEKCSSVRRQNLRII